MPSNAPNGTFDFFARSMPAFCSLLPFALATVCEYSRSRVMRTRRVRPMPDREMSRNRSLFRRPAVSLPARHTQPSSKGPGTAAFSVALRRPSHSTESTRPDWLSGPVSERTPLLGEIFLLGWENTGNFIDFGRGGAERQPKKAIKSLPYEPISVRVRTGNNFYLTGN